MSSSNTVINPKPCSYNCGVRIYWSVADNAYFEVFTKQKHICKNRPSKLAADSSDSKTNTNRPYYSKKPWPQKPKMSNSFELLTGPISEVQKRYETLSDIVTSLNGTTHGSQSHIGANNTISIVVYFGVAEGRLNEFKQRFKSIVLHNR